MRGTSPIWAHHDALAHLRAHGQHWEGQPMVRALPETLNFPDFV
jgi:hypothetical protein